ncbi:hypothetical protein [Helicobacter sp. 11S02596-1]|uniref:CCA tRNA nucleotidyltransferase n=1 Tax=Helicobacter sp. 11S02596-1 TaxID=1476194 RepID=UPI000BD221AD|nr:hypothetical protein [Helicobacter sp. 11S02596-1]PAF43207.1 hypothetical protein BJI48_05540 [Helicobacter sp. 11S02596-1]
MVVIDLPSSVVKIIQILENNGFEAFVVGGCVRDSLLQQSVPKFANIAPKDWDIATSAKPLEAMEVLQSANFHIVPTGVAYGTISVIINHRAYEVTTYRIDGEYHNHRKPKQVFFTPHLRQDLSRRDFTINAMAYHPSFGLIDPYGGQKDLEAKRIVAVGEAKKRFEEDALRILRALRFASRFGFEIASRTNSAMFACQKLLDFVSKERIKEEFRGIICGEFAREICVQYTPIIFENLSFSPTPLSLEILQHCPQDFATRFLALLPPPPYPSKAHSKSLQAFCKDILEQIFATLPYDKKFKTTIDLLYRHAFRQESFTGILIKKYLRAMGEDNFGKLLDFKIAHAQALGANKEIQELCKVAKDFQKILEEKQAFRLQDLKVNGDDIHALGITQGKEIGKVLELLLDGVINGEVANSKTDLIAFVKKIYLYK